MGKSVVFWLTSRNQRFKPGMKGWGVMDDESGESMSTKKNHKRVVYLKQPEIARYSVTNAQIHNVARNQLACQKCLQLPAADAEQCNKKQVAMLTLAT